MLDPRITVQWPPDYEIGKDAMERNIPKFIEWPFPFLPNIGDMIQGFYTIGTPVHVTSIDWLVQSDDDTMSYHTEIVIHLREGYPKNA